MHAARCIGSNIDVPRDTFLPSDCISAFDVDTLINAHERPWILCIIKSVRTLGLQAHVPILRFGTFPPELFEKTYWLL
jgi:hypothetical protein